MTGKNDVTSPSALLFVDALGETLPFRAAFTFKELSDFCRREGIMNLAGSNSLSENELLSIANKISAITNGHIQISPKPLRKTSRNRSPLSKVDMEVANHMAGSKCRKCQAKTDHRLYCDPCREKTSEMLYGKPSPHKPKILEKKKEREVKMGALVLLADGSRVHVVDKVGSTLVGMADDFSTHRFVDEDIIEATNLEDPIEKKAYEQCPVCGEKMYDYDEKCRVCKYTKDVPIDKWKEGPINWGGV